MDNELSRVVDALPGLVWTTLPDGKADFLNQRWLEYTGLSAEAAKGMGWLDCVHPDDASSLLLNWMETIASRKHGEFEARMRRSDGVYRWFRFRASPLRGDLGNIVRWCGINTDIEDSKRAEDNLRALEDRYRSIIDGLPTVVTLLATDGHIAHANRHMLSYLGTTATEMRAQSIDQAFHPDDRPEVLARWDQSSRTGQPYDLQARLRRADGVYRWFHTVGFPLRDADDKIDLWYFLQTDIHDNKCAEALLSGEKRFLEMAMSGHSMSRILEELCLLVEDTLTRSSCAVALVDQTGKCFEYGVAPSLPGSFLTSILGRLISDQSSPCGTALHLNSQVIAADLIEEAQWEPYEWCSQAVTQGLKACWATPIWSTDGTVLGALAIYYDYPRAPSALHRSLIEQFKHVASVAIERVQKESALSQSEAFLKEGQRLSSTGSFHWLVATNEITWSEQLYRLFEADPNTPVTLELIAQRFHVDDLPLMREMVDRATRDDENLEYEFRLLMPGGAIKYVHMVAHSTRERTGQIEYIGALQDVTDRRVSEEALNKARSQLAHVSRMMSLGVLTASIVHEVSQPLSGIITNAGTCLRMLVADPPNVDGARETAIRTIRDGDRASEVITRLRALFIKKPMKR